MWKGLRRQPNEALAAVPRQELSESGSHASGSHEPGYRPAVDARAQRLIARIQRDHGDMDAVMALKQHYLAHADLPSLANLLEGWAATLRDERSAADAYLEAAHAVLQALADRPRAKALLQRALERDPAHLAALEQLIALYEQDVDDAAIEHCLQSVAGQLGRRLALPELRASVHYRLGRHYEQRLSLPGRAIAEYRAALELDPHLREAIRAARAIYLATQRNDAAAAMYELEIAAIDDVAEQYRLLRELSLHRRGPLDDLDGAVVALRRALKALPQEPTALEALAELLAERAGQAKDDAAEADRGRAAELYFQVARCVPRSDARQHLLACRALAPDHARAARMLTELDAYGAQRGAPALGFLSQVELEALDTGVYRTPPPNPDTPTRPAAPLDELTEADEEITAWLEDDAVELIDEDVAVRHMVSVSDRPPASTAPNDKPHDTLRNELA